MIKMPYKLKSDNDSYFDLRKQYLAQLEELYGKTVKQKDIMAVYGWSRGTVSKKLSGLRHLPGSDKGYFTVDVAEHFARMSVNEEIAKRQYIKGARKNG